MIPHIETPYECDFCGQEWPIEEDFSKHKCVVKELKIEPITIKVQMPNPEEWK